MGQHKTKKEDDAPQLSLLIQVAKMGKRTDMAKLSGGKMAIGQPIR